MQTRSAAAARRRGCSSTATTPGRGGSARTSTRCTSIACCRRATNVPHSIKLNGFYELPFGRGKRFGTDMAPGLLDSIAGGWSLSMTGRMQKRTLSISDAVLVGMTVDELQSEYEFRIDREPGGHGCCRRTSS